MADNISIF